MRLNNRDPGIIPRSHNIGGAQIFPQVWEQPQESRLQDGDVHQVEDPQILRATLLNLVARESWC
jgi:hypothetical protein